jgi:hypothetical protein
VDPRPMIFPWPKLSTREKKANSSTFGKVCELFPYLNGFSIQIGWLLQSIAPLAFLFSSHLYSFIASCIRAAAMKDRLRPYRNIIVACCEVVGVVDLEPPTF